MFAKSKYHDGKDYESNKRGQAGHNIPPRANLLAAMNYMKTVLAKERIDWAAMGGITMLALGSSRAVKDIHIVYDVASFAQIKFYLEKDTVTRLRTSRDMNSLCPAKIIVETGPSRQDHGCVENTDVEVILIPSGCNGTPSNDILRKHQILVQLTINNQTENLKSLDMLYLVRTTLQYSRRSDLSWDPTADLVFLCERCPSDIASIRHQLNKQDLEDCLFRTPFFSSLPVETRRICSQVLLGIDCSLKPSKTAGIQETVPNSAPNHSRQLNARQLRHNSGNANGGSRGHSPGMKRQSLGPMARPVSFQTFLQQQTQHQKSSSPAPLKRKPVRGHLPNALVSSTSNAPPIANTQRLPIFIPEPLPNSNNKLLPVPDPKSLPTANNQPLPIYNHLPFASQKSNLSAGLGSGYAAFTVNRPQVSHRYSQPPPSEYTAYNAPSPLTIFTGASIPPPHRLPKPHPPRLFIQTVPTMSVRSSLVADRTTYQHSGSDHATDSIRPPISTVESKQMTKFVAKIEQTDFDPVAAGVFDSPRDPHPIQSPYLSQALSLNALKDSWPEEEEKLGAAYEELGRLIEHYGATVDETPTSAYSDNSFFLSTPTQGYV